MLETQRTRPKPFRLTAWEISENEIHVSLVAALHKFCAPNVCWLHIGNGEKRDAITGARLKRMGLRPGASDLLFVRPNTPPLFLELKDRTGRQSQSQIEFQTLAEAAGCEYMIARSLDSALDLLWRRGFLARRLV